MRQYIEVIKDISAILGVIISLSAVLSLLSKNVRKFFCGIFKKYNNTDTLSTDISELKALMEQHLQDNILFKNEVTEMNKINIEFMQNQCRNTIKDIFYKHKDTKVLPLYEKKTLIMIEELYIKKLQANSFAKLLLEEMAGWEVDYESSHPSETDTSL